MAAERMSGTVKWFSRVKGYGFIAPDDEETEIFVHFTGIEGEGYRNLEKGEKVSFVVEDTEKGPQAVQVRAEGFDVTSWTAEPTDEPAEGVVGETSWRAEDEAEASESEEETSDELEQDEAEASEFDEESSDELEQDEAEAPEFGEESSDELEQDEAEA
ncbi:MAG: cold-shock protein, partial [Anaerolineales bacterium]